MSSAAQHERIEPRSLQAHGASKAGTRRDVETHEQTVARLRSEIIKTDCVLTLERADVIAELRQTATGLVLRGRFVAALGVVDQMLVLEPDDSSARNLRWMLRALTRS